MIKHLLAFNTQTELSPYLAVDLIARLRAQRALKFKKNVQFHSKFLSIFLKKNNEYFWKGRFPKPL